MTSSRSAPSPSSRHRVPTSGIRFKRTLARAVGPAGLNRIRNTGRADRIAEPQTEQASMISRGARSLWLSDLNDQVVSRRYRCGGSRIASPRRVVQGYFKRPVPAIRGQGCYAITKLLNSLP